MKIRELVCRSVFLVLASAQMAGAQGDPPALARIGLIEGEASYQLRDSSDWVGVSVNAPLLSGDRFYVGPSSRAEVQLAAGLYARLGADTEVALVEIASDATQLHLPLGSMILRVGNNPEGRHIELGTPLVALVVEAAGTYRVNVGRGGRTTVRVESGRIHGHARGESFEVRAGATVEVEEKNGVLHHRQIQDAGPDGLDRWEAHRNLRVSRSRSYRYVHPEIYGVEDLDAHGIWENREGYGAVWRPTTVASDWAPYRDGRWVWVEPWGWTWLDYAAWGWAPFHYGRWLRLSGSWYWSPGTRVERPVYSPALVAFYGAGVSLGVSGGYFGWVPLGFGEPCFPWWSGVGRARRGVAWWGGWGGPRIVNNIFVSPKEFGRLRLRDVRHVNL